jgi:hypothetical protein
MMFRSHPIGSSPPSNGSHSNNPDLNNSVSIFSHYWIMI